MRAMSQQVCLPPFRSVINAFRATAVCLLAGLSAAGCASTTLEQDQSALQERVEKSHAELLRELKATPANVPDGSTPTGATGRSVDRWLDLRDNTRLSPFELRVEVERMMADADREWVGADSRSLLLSGAELMHWREANEQLRQARSRLQSQLSTLETVSPDRQDEVKREIEASWQLVRQRLDEVVTSAPR